VTDNEPIEQHPNAGKFLLDARLLHFTPAFFDVRRHMERLDGRKLMNAVVFAPIKKAHGGAEVRPAGVRIAD
jgi:hypothetical protein